MGELSQNDKKLLYCSFRVVNLWLHLESWAKYWNVGIASQDFENHTKTPWIGEI